MTEMIGNNAFELVGERGWRRGLGNLLRAGFGSWWKSNTWWIMTLMWTLIINGILAGVIWSEGDMGWEGSIALYSMFAGIFPAIAVVIIMQDAIVGEKESGTAAWVLSKPVSRSSFVVSKLVSNSVSMLITMALIPGLFAYLQIALSEGSLLSPFNFLGGLLVICLNLLYYLTLTLMLGTLFNHRGPVIGIPLALAFGQQLIFGILPMLSLILPWTLIVPVNNVVDMPIAASVMLGQEIYSVIPLISVSIQIVLFIIIALWRFEREEF
jgi:ABC-2 type transport system permease protein